jgi:pyridoxal/pyridoxine/pyridoxamine kinase
MDLNNQFEVEHLFFVDRKCRTCEIEKNLIDDFYKTRKNQTILSSYSYECKKCTIKRIQNSRKNKILSTNYEYPDW